MVDHNELFPFWKKFQKEDSIGWDADWLVGDAERGAFLRGSWIQMVVKNE